MIPGLPYDHQLEYIESTGSQYIDTGITKPNVGAVTRWEGLAGFDSDYTSQRNFVCAYDYISLLYYCEFNQSQFGGVGWNVRYFCNTTLEDKRLYPVSMQLSGTTVTYSVEVDGETITKTATPSRQQDSAVGSKFLLFCLQPGQYKGQGVRIGRSRLFIDDILVGDYIPVSANGVAMMYDRLTGTFPRHYGTFMAGPVASTPLMGLHFYNKAPTADAYPHEGLIGMWHASENTGDASVMDSNAQIWRNMAQDKWHLNVDANAGWKRNCIYKGATGNFMAGTYPGTLMPLTSDEVKLARTVEMVAMWSKIYGDTRNVCIFFSWASAANSGKYILADGTGVNAIHAQVRSGNSYGALSGGYSAIPANSIFKISVDFQESVSARPTRFEINGTPLTGTSAAGRDCGPGVMLGGPPTWIYTLIGNIYSVRVYNRVLTPDERAYTNRLDHELFGIPLGV